jgi:glycosyltransferase involved in cell wall biosynthesis
MVTIHDFDRLYRISGIRAALFRIIYFELPLRRCQCVTTISPQIAKEMERLFPWVMPKVAIVPDCLPAGFDRVPKEFQSERPVILQIGTKPNKNLERLVSAIEGLKCKLHIVGPLSGQQRSQLEQGGVTYQNSVDVSEGDLRRAYAEADIVSFVSTYEGFGLPILEANAVGRPVVTSNVPPMPEVAGQAACLVDPLSVPSIRQGLLRVIGDPNYRAELVTHGLENIKRYSAGQVARQYAALYEGLAAGCLVARHHPDGAVETI